MSGAAFAVLAAAGAAPLAITTASLPGAAAGSGYGAGIATSGGIAPISFAIVSGALPPGLSLNGASGVVSGTPSTVGSYGFTVRASDAAAKTASHAYSLAVSGSPITITTSSLPTPVLGSAYSQAIGTVGGAAPLSWGIVGGALPAGLSLDAASGLVSGTPTTPGAYSFNVLVADIYSDAASQGYSGVIADQTITVGTSSINIKSTFFNQAGYSPGISGSSITPTSFAGATIIVFCWSNSSGGGPSFAGPGTVGLTLSGNTGSGARTATVGGTSLGASAAGVYDSGSDTTAYDWTNITDPFGSTVGAVLEWTLA